METRTRYARLQIRRTTYRGVAGFLVVGRTYPGSAFLTRIFTHTRDGAEEIRDALTWQPREEAQRIVSQVLLAKR